MLHRLLALSALPLFGCQQADWLVVETEASNLCVVDMVLEIEAAPVAASGRVEKTLVDQDLGLELSDQFEAQMFLSGVGMSAGEGIDDFDFIDKVKVSGRSEDGEVVVLLDYDAQEDEGAEWFLPSDSAIDIAAALEDEGMELSIEFVGELPTQDWTITMDVCVDASAAFKQSL